MGEFQLRLTSQATRDPRDLNACCTHLLGGQHTEKADRAVTDDRAATDDRDCVTRLQAGRVGGEPAGAQDVGGRQQARDQVVRRDIRCGHQGAVRQWDAQHAEILITASVGLMIVGTSRSSKRMSRGP